MSLINKIMTTIFGGPEEKTEAPKVVTPGTQPQPPMQETDVAAILDRLADKQEQDLDWRGSIVDLMKLLKMDSSLAQRKELAKELNYMGSTNDTVAMNTWLHKEVMRKLAENGGQLPSELRDQWQILQATKKSRQI